MSKEIASELVSEVFLCPPFSEQARIDFADVGRHYKSLTKFGTDRLGTPPLNWTKIEKMSLTSFKGLLH